MPEKKLVERFSSSQQKKEKIMQNRNSEKSKVAVLVDHENLFLGKKNYINDCRKEIKKLPYISYDIYDLMVKIRIYGNIIFKKLFIPHKHLNKPATMNDMAEFDKYGFIIQTNPDYYTCNKNTRNIDEYIKKDAKFLIDNVEKLKVLIIVSDDGDFFSLAQDAIDKGIKVIFFEIYKMNHLVLNDPNIEVEKVNFLKKYYSVSA